MLACGDAGAAIELAGGKERARHLIQLASTKRYLDVRRKLRTRQVEPTTRPFAR
jgi:hypothetical protein